MIKSLTTAYGNRLMTIDKNWFWHISIQCYYR